jgi:hypothetical protein
MIATASAAIAPGTEPPSAEPIVATFATAMPAATHEMAVSSAARVRRAAARSAAAAFLPS